MKQQEKNKTRKNCYSESRKKVLYEKRATRKKCNSEKGATWKEYNMKKVKHGKSAIQNECNTKKKVHHEKGTRKV